MFWRNNFYPYLTAIFVAFALVILPNNAFASVKDDMDELTKAIQKAPNVAVNYNDRGWIYFALQDYANAEKDFKKAIELNKEQTYSYRGLAYVYLNTGKNKDAEKCFIEYGNRSYEPEEALEAYTAAIELNDKNAETYILRGQIYHKMQDYDKALNDFNKAVELDKNSAGAYSGRAAIYKEQGKIDNAKQDFFAAGKKYHDAKKYTTAKEYFNQALELDDKYGEAYYWLGMSEKWLENYPDALDNVTKAIKFNYSDKAYAYNQHGYLLIKTSKNYEEAIKDFDKAIDFDSNLAITYSNRGDAYYNLTKSEDLSSFKQYYYKWNAASDFVKYLELSTNLKESTIEFYNKKIEECKTPLDGLFGVLEIFGEFNIIFKVLLIAIVLDYVIIIACGLRAGTLTAGVAAQELFKEVIILLVVAVVNAFENVDTLKKLDVRDFVIAIILLYQLYYIAENSERLGVPVPDWLKEMLQTIREKIEGIFSRR